MLARYKVTKLVSFAEHYQVWADSQENAIERIEQDNPLPIYSNIEPEYRVEKMKGE